MVQHIGLQIEHDDGELIATFDSGRSIDVRVIEHASAEGGCLRFIDPYGDTAFNCLQLEELLRELKLLQEGTTDAEFAVNIQSMLDFLGPYRAEVHFFVRFIGD